MSGRPEVRTVIGRIEEEHEVRTVIGRNEEEHECRMDAFTEEELNTKTKVRRFRAAFHLGESDNTDCEGKMEEGRKKCFI